MKICLQDGVFRTKGFWRKPEAIILAHDPETERRLFQLMQEGVWFDERDVGLPRGYLSYLRIMQ
jgi:hypothetical protein